jgi:hypothetical protein
MGQASCNDVAKAPEESNGTRGSSPSLPPKTDETPPLMPPASLSKLEKGSCQNGHAVSSVSLAVQFSEADIARFSETPEIQRLREDLRSKEKAMTVMQEHASKHLKHIEVLEQELFQKDEGIKRLQASESTQQEVSVLLEQLQEKDRCLQALRQRVEKEESTLNVLTLEAVTKGEVVEDLKIEVDRVKSRTASCSTTPMRDELMQAVSPDPSRIVPEAAALRLASFTSPSTSKEECTAPAVAKAPEKSPESPVHTHHASKAEGSIMAAINAGVAASHEHHLHEPRNAS